MFGYCKEKHSTAEADGASAIAKTGAVHGIKKTGNTKATKMKKNIIILVACAYGLTSCVQTKYFVKSAERLSHINLERSVVNSIPLQQAALDSSRVLDSTYALLTLKKYATLKNYLAGVGSNSSDYHLARTLYYISRAKYRNALTSLQQVDTAYLLLRQLLLIDLRYEQSKIDGVTAYKSFLRDYQELIDQYPDDDLLKKIVAIRIRYIRYNY
jgi:hypothetical protein